MNILYYKQSESVSIKIQSPKQLRQNKFYNIGLQNPNNGPFVYSYENNLTSTTCLPSTATTFQPDKINNHHNQHQHQHQINPYMHEQEYANARADSLSSVNYFLPGSETQQASDDFAHLEDEAQFEFGGCSQEEISNLVDQVLSSIDVFTTTSAPTTTTTTQTTATSLDAINTSPASGSLCQDCGNFVAFEASLERLETVCQDCGAAIKFDRLAADEDSEKVDEKDFDQFEW